MPDVVIWMISGDKRIAYFRIPANELLFAKDPNLTGRKCGKLQSIQLKVRYTHTYTPARTHAYTPTHTPRIPI
jgi:hypothetical protein